MMLVDIFLSSLEEVIVRRMILRVARMKAARMKVARIRLKLQTTRKSRQTQRQALAFRTNLRFEGWMRYDDDFILELGLDE